MKKINKKLLSLSLFALAIILPVQAQEAHTPDMKMHQHHAEMMKMMTDYNNQMKAELKKLNSLKGDEKINKMAEILTKMIMHQEKMQKMHENMMPMMDKKMMHHHK